MDRSLRKGPGHPTHAGQPATTMHLLAGRTDADGNRHRHAAEVLEELHVALGLLREVLGARASPMSSSHPGSSSA